MSIAIGIDVSKRELDIYYAGKSFKLANTKAALEDHFKAVDRDWPVVMESTGKYHRLSHSVLEDMGFAVMVTNPLRVRRFGQASGVLCKTDKVDAKLLSEFGIRMDFKKTPYMSEEAEERQTLLRHLDGLKRDKGALKVKLHGSEGMVRKSIEGLILVLKEEIRLFEQALTSLIDKDSELSKKRDILKSMPGIGETTAVVLLVSMKELGRLKKTEVAALSGLAPMNKDSGRSQGARHIKGGRKELRTHLYMPVLSSATRNTHPRLKAFYDKLVATGKPKKVALTACMRKQLVWANALLASGKCWDESLMTV